MKRFKWVVEFEVSETWVSDGFTGTQEDFQEMLENRLDYAYFTELKAKVIKKPTDKSLAKSQGFKSVKDFKDSFK